MSQYEFQTFFCLFFPSHVNQSEQKKYWLIRSLCVFLQKIIEEVEEMLNNLPGVTSVHGRFYDLSSKYYRIIGNHAAYYKDALRYLGCVDLKDLPGEAACLMEMIPGCCWMVVVAQSEELLSPQRQRSRRGPSRWALPASSEKESTTLESWWDSRCFLHPVY